MLPPTYLLGGIAIQVALHVMLPWRQVIVGPWRLLGVLLLALGITLYRRADECLIRHDTTSNPYERPHALAADGPFRRTRNPMYLGMTLTVLGISVLMGTLTPLVVVIALPIMLDRTFIVHEEAVLESVFGSEFVDYRGNVRRWI
jgi:protein-S-isoprenylcysteine O-methyltransferase Ste14